MRIKDVSDQWECWSAWGDDIHNQAGPSRIWRIGSGGAAESSWKWNEGNSADVGLREGEIGCWDLRAGFGIEGMGRQLLIPRGKKRRSYTNLSIGALRRLTVLLLASLMNDHDEVPTDEYHLHRMKLGIPEGPQEIVPGSALPLESCMDVHGGG